MRRQMGLQESDTRISCVIPCLNAAPYLNATLAAILAAAAEKDEIIAVYDQSGDNTLEILRAFAPRVRTIVRDPSEAKGAAAAINRGFATATGEIFCWLGADDYIFPWAFEVVRGVFAQHPEVCWVTSTQPCVMRDGAVSAGRVKGISRDYFLDGFTLPGERRGAGWIQQESTFWRKSLWQRAGGHLDESLKLAFDFDLWARFFQHAEICGIDSLLSAFRYRDGQLSADAISITSECRRLLDKARCNSGWRSNRLKECLLLISRLNCHVGRRIGISGRFYSWTVVSKSIDGFWRPRRLVFWP